MTSALSVVSLFYFNLIFFVFVPVCIYLRYFMSFKTSTPSSSAIIKSSRLSSAPPCCCTCPLKIWIPHLCTGNSCGRLTSCDANVTRHLFCMHQRNSHITYSNINVLLLLMIKFLPAKCFFFQQVGYFKFWSYSRNSLTPKSLWNFHSYITLPAPNYSVLKKPSFSLKLFSNYSSSPASIISLLVHSRNRHAVSNDVLVAFRDILFPHFQFTSSLKRLRNDYSNSSSPWKEFYNSRFWLSIFSKLQLNRKWHLLNLSSINNSNSFYENFKTELCKKFMAISTSKPDDFSKEIIDEDEFDSFNTFRTSTVNYSASFKIQSPREYLLNSYKKMNLYSYFTTSFYQNKA